MRKYARVEGVTLPPSEEICPSRGSNSPTAGAQNLTQFGEKGKNDGTTDKMWSPGGEDFSNSITDFCTLIISHDFFCKLWDS